MHMNKMYWLGGLGILIIVGAAIALAPGDTQFIDETGVPLDEPVELSPSLETWDTAFRCSDEVTLTTSYNLGSGLLTLTIADETYELVQIVGPNGARYESPDGQVSYVEFEGESTVTIDRRTAAAGCVPIFADE